MSAALVLAVLLGASEPDCGVVGLAHIDRAAYAVVHGMKDSLDEEGRVSTAFFAEPLSSALDAEQRRWERGQPPRLARDWLTGGGPMDAAAELSLHSLNRSGVDDIVMGLGFTNAEGERVYRRLSLGCYDGRWRIRSIFLHPEDVFLNELLSTAP